MLLRDYLDSRNDNNPFLFCSNTAQNKQLTTGAIRTILKKIQNLSNVPNVHPHRFRRTTATLALNRGMPIEQVKEMLGHEKIETTTIYAKSNNENINQSHKRFLN